MPLTPNEIKALENCECKIRDRREGEPMRDWLKDCMCMYHWMQSDYYRKNLLNEVYQDTNYEPPNRTTTEHRKDPESRVQDGFGPHQDDIG